MKDKSTVHALYLRALTPVHVGAASEKHLKEGIDYLQRGDTLYLFDHDRLARHPQIGVDAFANALVQGGKDAIAELLKIQRVDPAQVSRTLPAFSGQADDLRAHIREGLQGRLILPGSSVKGALRSILFRYFYLQEPLPGDKGIDNKILGAFDRSLMRFIHCSDVVFAERAVYNSKIFNLTGGPGHWQGGWKHQGSTGATARFRPQGFTTAYECVPPEAVGAFRLTFDHTGFEQNKTRLPKSVQSFPAGKTFLAFLNELISKHSQTYLDKEIAFFSRHELAETTRIRSAFEALKSANQEETPVFRMAAGSGFFSITGDWQHDDHLRTLEQESNNRGDHKKSRRLAFLADENGDYRFYPMGFVQLVTEDDYQKRLLPAIEARRKEEAERRAAEARRAEEERRRAEAAAEAARRPRTRTLKEVKKENKIDGEVVGKVGKQVQIRPFVEGYESQTLEVRYPAGFPKGTIVEVKASLQGKTLVLHPPVKEKK